MKRFGFGMLLVVVGVLALLVTAELVLRATGLGLRGGAQRGLHQLRLDRPWIYGLRPGVRVTLPLTGDVVYAINADGFRDRLHPIEPAADWFRVLVLGGSITFGFGVPADAAYTTRLEELLAERSAPQVEVMNLGVNGYNAYNEAALLVDRGLGYRPNLVLTEFCVAGLHDPALHFDVQTRFHLGMIPEDALPNPEEMRREPPAFESLLRTCRKLQVCSLIDDAVLALTAEKRDVRERAYALRPRELPDGPERRWLRARYREMAAAADSIGARFGVVVFPYASQIYGDGSARLQQQLVLLGREEGWPVLDLLPAFLRAAEQGAPPLLLDSWHPSAAGHDVAAVAIAEWLQQERLLSR